MGRQCVANANTNFIRTIMCLYYFTTYPKFIMLIINIKDNETIDRALGRYKKKVRDTQLLKEVRRRKSFEKPSVTRRGQILKAVHKLSVQREANEL